MQPGAVQVKVICKRGSSSDVGSFNLVVVGASAGGAGASGGTAVDDEDEDAARIAAMLGAERPRRMRISTRAVVGRDAPGVIRLRSAGGTPTLRKRREGSIVSVVGGRRREQATSKTIDADGRISPSPPSAPLSYHFVALSLHSHECIIGAQLN